MERKIGETFEFEGKKIEVKAAINGDCDGCILDEKCTRINQAIVGECEGDKREDRMNVTFAEVQEQQDEQPQEQAEQQTEQPQGLNLCEILKYCPEGEPLWSPMLGDVKLFDINQEAKMVVVELESGEIWDINADGTLIFGNVTSQEIMLYPSREQRDWTKVKYEPKKELPKTWEEFCQQNPTLKLEYFIDDSSCVRKAKSEGDIRHKGYDRNTLPSKQAAEAHLALMQLHQLRDAWREGWLPDWNDYGQNKYVIALVNGDFTIGEYHTISRFLAFQDNRAEEFKNCFIDLIRQAGDLI